MKQLSKPSTGNHIKELLFCFAFSLACAVGLVVTGIMVASKLID
jgi:hypothetical protein